MYKPFQKLECKVILKKGPGEYFVQIKETGVQAILCDTESIEPGEEVYGLFMAEHDGRCMLAATSHRGTERVQN